jgi:hypothetical protein
MNTDDSVESRECDGRSIRMSFPGDLAFQIVEEREGDALFVLETTDHDAGVGAYRASEGCYGVGGELAYRDKGFPCRGWYQKLPGPVVGFGFKRVVIVRNGWGIEEDPFFDLLEDVFGLVEKREPEVVGGFEAEAQLDDGVFALPPGGSADTKFRQFLDELEVDSGGIAQGVPLQLGDFHGFRGEFADFGQNQPELMFVVWLDLAAARHALSLAKPGCHNREISGGFFRAAE